MIFIDDNYKLNEQILGNIDEELDLGSEQDEIIPLHKGGAPAKFDNKQVTTPHDAINQYFKLKREYREMYKDKKQKQKKQNNKRNIKQNADIVLPCVRCRKKGGTEFTNKDRIYYAKCGNPDKTCFEIKVLMWNNVINLEKNYIKIKNSEDVKKEVIIRQKMDTFFGYTDQTNSAEAFKKQIEKFVKENSKLLLAKKKYDNVFNKWKAVEFVTTYLQHMDSVGADRILTADGIWLKVSNPFQSLQDGMKDLRQSVINSFLEI